MCTVGSICIIFEFTNKTFLYLYSLFDCDTGFFVECRPLNCADFSFQVQSMLFDELFYD